MATQGAILWSTTAASNANSDPTVNWAEGQAPSTVNNSARAEMASAKRWILDVSGTLTAAGTSTAYTLATNATFAAAADMDGAMIVFRVGTTNGVDVTLAVDGLTARQIVTATGVNVAAGQLIASQIYAVTYVHATTDFRLHNFVPISIVGLTAETAVAVADVFPFYDDSATANRKVTVPNLFKAISVLDSEATIATDDQLLISDTSDSAAANRITVANFLKITDALTEDTAPDEAADFLLSYDTSSSAAKKVKPNNILIAENQSTTAVTASTDFNGVIPADDTKPQSGEGSEITTGNITPATTSSKVRIRFSGWVSCSAAASVFVALFRSGSADALQVTAVTVPSSNALIQVFLEYLDSPASASQQTYSIRAGTAAGNTIRFNGSSSARLFGGAASAALMLEQVNV